MPRRKVYRKRRPRKTRRVVKYVRPPLPLNGQRHSEIVKLRYVETISLTSTSSQVYNYRANSVYDPNETSTGHQPMGFDQMALKYNHYLVLGARMKVSPIITGDTHNAGDAPSYVILKLKDNAQFDQISTEHMLESEYYGKNKKMIVSNYQAYMSNNNTKTLSCYFSPSKFFGKTKSQYRADDKSQSIINTNPTEDAIFQIAAFPVSAGTRDPITLLVEIDYVVQFSEAKDLPQS